MNLHYTYHNKNIFANNNFSHYANGNLLIAYTCKILYIQNLAKKSKMPIKFKLKKDVLISSYELDALFSTHLYELLNVVC